MSHRRDVQTFFVLVVRDGEVKFGMRRVLLHGFSIKTQLGSRHRGLVLAAVGSDREKRGSAEVTRFDDHAVVAVGVQVEDGGGGHGLGESDDLRTVSCSRGISNDEDKRNKASKHGVNLR